MKARFIGDPAHDHEGPTRISLFGRVFPKGRFITIDGDDAAHALRKLSGNNHFEVAEGEGDAAETPKPDPLDHDRDGKKGGSRTKAVIIADLTAMAERHPEVTFDPTATNAALEARLEELRFEFGEDD